MLTAQNLKVEYKTNPLGMDEMQPRFSWELSGNSMDQSACRIVVKEDGKKVVWDSGFIRTNLCNQICYGGEALKKFTRYDWTVQLKDEKGKTSPVSKEEAFFETGFLSSPWEGKWIAARGGTGYLLPPQRLLRRFEVKKKVKKARLYTAVLGLYEAFINGKNVTEDVFTPGWTDYYKRVQYQAYDVTALIVKGKNMLADVIAEGWFCGKIARNWTHGMVSYGPHPAMSQELHLTYEDGTTEKIVSNSEFRSFSVTDCPPAIRMSDIYMGETYDATEDDVSWKLPTKEVFDETAPIVLENEALEDYFSNTPRWSHRRSMPKIEWQSGAPVRRIMTVKPVKITKRKDANTFVVDFGQNLTGRERFTLKNTKRGTSILIRHGEMLNDDGSLYTSNLRAAAATTHYLAGNAKSVTYEPTFTYYGFRYLEISGWPGELKEDQIEAVVIHSDLEETGAFECSNPLLNQLFSNIVWGQRSNFLDVPTDCPQRDERLGWTGDTQVFANVATYNMYCPEFYTKWIRDLNLTQMADGGYKHYVPDPYSNSENPRQGATATGWGDAGIICPDVMFRKYGDLRLIRLYFDNMKRHLYSQINRAGNSYLVKNACFGDWLNIDDPTDESLLSTAYLAGMAKMLAHHAGLLGRAEDQLELEQMAAATKKAFQQTFFKNDQLQAKSQTAMLLVLHFDLAPEKAYKNVCNALVKSIKVTHKVHLSTGFLGTPILLSTLTKIGEIDLAYDLLQQTTYPGWLYPVTQGATTMWERWNSWNEKTGFADIHMNSFNHYAYGAVGDWFYETICGIQPLSDCVEHAGFKRFKLAPRFGKSLEYASAAFRCPYGEIASGWKRIGDTVLWFFDVPVGTTAEIDLPGAEKALLAAGVVKCKDCGKLIAAPGEYQVEVKIK